MDKRTPGPWFAVEHYADHVTVIDSRGFEIVEATDTPILLDYAEKLGIAHWADRPGQAFIELDPKEQAANARLIAAAPDLLAAAKALWEESDNPTLESVSDKFRALAAAIAKAEGRE